jgi:hypothetical protein
MTTNTSPIAVLLPMAVAATFFLLVGMWFLRTPTKKLLDWDLRTGYWLYRYELEQSGDENLAIESAGCFYKFFGLFCIVSGLLCLLVVLAALIGFVTGTIKFNLITNKRHLNHSEQWYKNCSHAPGSAQPAVSPGPRPMPSAS